jgi:hypothetical protein
MRRAAGFGVMKRMLKPGDRIELFRDRSQDNRDRYDRLLRYVELEGRDIGRKQLRRGWASVYVFDLAYRRCGPIAAPLTRPERWTVASGKDAGASDAPASAVTPAQRRRSEELPNLAAQIERLYENHRDVASPAGKAAIMREIRARKRERRERVAALAGEGVRPSVIAAAAGLTRSAVRRPARG